MGSRVEFGTHDREGRGSSQEAMGGISEGQSSTRCRVDDGRDRAAGRMVSGSNEQHSRCHGKVTQVLCQAKLVVEGRHQRMKEVGRDREQERTEFGRGCPRRCTALEVNLGVQDTHVGR